jgi:hypothetical protein
MEVASMTDQIVGKARGGKAAAALLTPEQRKDRAQKAALSRWQPSGDIPVPEAIRDGQLQIGDIWIDCYVLKDGRRLFHKRGLAKALGLKSEGGNAFMKSMGRKSLGSVITGSLREKLDNPVIFKPLSGDPAHGYEGIFVIELCDAIWEAGRAGKLHPNQEFLSKQSEIIVRSSAKVGIIALIDEATGYIKDKQKEEYRELFKEFIRSECREWEKEFPDQFFEMLYRMYNLKRNKDKTRHPQFFGKFIRKYIYSPLANSKGAILEMLDEKNPVVYKSGGRKFKMFTFLSDEIGLPSFRAHMWQIIGIGNATRTKEGFQKGFNSAFPKSGDQMGLFEDDI